MCWSVSVPILLLESSFGEKSSRGLTKKKNYLSASVTVHQDKAEYTRSVDKTRGAVAKLGVRVAVLLCLELGAKNLSRSRDGMVKK